MNSKQYRTTEQDMEMMHALRSRTMRRYDLSLEQVVRNNLDEPQMEEHARATLAADIKRTAAWEKEAMGRFRNSIAKRYSITVRQVVQNGLDRPLMEESARATLVEEIRRVQNMRGVKKPAHCDGILSVVGLQVLTA
jgi:hypothetical protein